MSIRGITMFRAMPQLVAAVAKAEGRSEHDETATELANAERHAAFAEHEANNGFPVLHANTALAVWSHLEAGIRLFLARWLQYEKAPFEIDAIQRLRVKIGEYERLQGEDRYFYIIDRLEQETAAPLRCGTSRFEVLLETFGLSGKLDADVQRDLFELNQVRNCLLHRAGRADRRLVDACPWLALEVGQQFKVTHDVTKQYIASAMHYATELVCRIGEHFGVDMAEHRR
ncbi:MAG: hypothetical protein HY040_15460 [Planctomycetes bacterium]|nr:hypothetical protein [Planctomycetota bacterium]